MAHFNPSSGRKEGTKKGVLGSADRASGRQGFEFNKIYESRRPSTTSVPNSREKRPDTEYANVLK